MGFEAPGLVFKNRDLDVIRLRNYVGMTPFDYPVSQYGLFALDEPQPDIVMNLNWYFDFENPRSPDDCAVVAFDDRGEHSPEDVMPVYDSFQELLSFWAFRVFSIEPKSDSTRLRFRDHGPDTRETFELATATLSQGGLVRILPQTPNCWVAEDESGSAAQLSALPHHRTSFTASLASDSRRLRKKLESLLVDALGAPIFRLDDLFLQK